MSSEKLVKSKFATWDLLISNMTQIQLERYNSYSETKRRKFLLIGKLFTEHIENQICLNIYDINSNYIIKCREKAIALYFVLNHILSMDILDQLKIYEGSEEYGKIYFETNEWQKCDRMMF